MNEYDNDNIKHEIDIIKSIQSKYILINIFSFLPEKLKLNIIIYNKNLQKKIDNINIEDYKRISRIYREGERNGKGKEYDKLTNIMIYEGEYLKGKRNGKGKEFNEIGETEFEGEYKDGKRWNGTLIEYDIDDGKIIFSGEISDGVKLKNK